MNEITNAELSEVVITVDKRPAQINDRHINPNNRMLKNL